MLIDLQKRGTSMAIIPFISLFIGGVIGFRMAAPAFLKGVDRATTVVLITLMLIIGANIGLNETIILKLGTIGLQCAVIALSAIFLSVLAVWLLEKTILPLDQLQKKLTAEQLPAEAEPKETGEEKNVPSLVLIMPVSIVAGIVIGYFLPQSAVDPLSWMLIFTLVLLYIGVGISIGSNKTVFKFIKLVGFRVIYLSLAIFVGSVLGGLLSGLIMNIPLEASVLSASGMSYYSITGAYMTQTYGIEIGTYGFLVNVMREFFTVLLLPLLIKISKGSPIAGGAAGTMDTMLLPVTKFVGAELGLIALITGTILTFAVPFLLPLLRYGLAFAGIV